MLDSLRKASSGWVAQLLIALLVVSFAVWGISGFFTGFNAEVVATVGNTDVTVRQFAREYETRLRQAGQQFAPFLHEKIFHIKKTRPRGCWRFGSRCRQPSR